ncbi:MAG: hypothetical protein IPM29_15955 [Planctomycetes bacterium]|nr:hypothetical protein [Planctomycetota bacterium]
MTALDATPLARRSGVDELLGALGSAGLRRALASGQHAVLRGGRSDRFDAVLDPAAVDRIVTSGAIGPAGLRVIRDGQRVPAERLALRDGGGLDVDAVLALYAAGHTLVVERIDRFDGRVQALCEELGARLRAADVLAHAYVTPPGGHRGLAPHFDEDDVLVLQLAGTKRWTLYEAQVRAPRSAHRAVDAAHRAGRVVDELVLAPGDLLVVPRGVVHAASSEGSASIHLTIGLLPLCWVDLCKAAVSLAARGDVALRRGFGADAGELAALARAQLARVGRDAVVAACRQARARLARGAAQPGEIGRLLGLGDAVELGPTTPLRARAQLDWQRCDDRVVLSRGGRRLELPAHVEVQLVAMRAAVRFTPAGLPGPLDAAGRVTLCRRLAREGYLEIEREAAGRMAGRTARRCADD